MNIEELTEKVRRYINVGRLLDIEVAETTDTGRVAALRVTGSRASGLIRGLKARWALGGKEMKCHLHARRNADGDLLGVYVSGTAWGHGVGLCQVGAYGMAARGADYRTILKHYYTGVEIERITGGQTADHSDK